MPNPNPAKHKPTEAERDERVSIHTGRTPEEALRLLMEVDPESEIADQEQPAKKRER